MPTLVAFKLLKLLLVLLEPSVIYIMIRTQQAPTHTTKTKDHETILKLNSSDVDIFKFYFFLNNSPGSLNGFHHPLGVLTHNLKSVFSEGEMG